MNTFRRNEPLAVPPPWEEDPEVNEALLKRSDLKPVPGTAHYYLHTPEYQGMFMENSGQVHIFDGSTKRFIPTHQCEGESWVAIQMANDLWQVFRTDDLLAASHGHHTPVADTNRYGYGGYQPMGGNYYSNAGIENMSANAFLTRRRPKDFTVKALDIVTGDFSLFPTLRAAGEYFGITAEKLLPFVDRKLETEITRVFRRRFKLAYGSDYLRPTEKEEVEAAQDDIEGITGYSLTHSIFGMWSNVAEFCMDRDVQEDEVQTHLKSDGPWPLGKDEWVLVYSRGKERGELTSFVSYHRARPDAKFVRNFTRDEWLKLTKVKQYQQTPTNDKADQFDSPEGGVFEILSLALGAIETAVGEDEKKQRLFEHIVTLGGGLFDMAMDLIGDMPELAKEIGEIMTGEQKVAEGLDRISKLLDAGVSPEAVAQQLLSTATQQADMDRVKKFDEDVKALFAQPQAGMGYYQRAGLELDEQLEAQLAKEGRQGALNYLMLNFHLGLSNTDDLIRTATANGWAPSQGLIDTVSSIGDVFELTPMRAGEVDAFLFKCVLANIQDYIDEANAKGGPVGYLPDLVESSRVNAAAFGTAIQAIEGLTSDNKMLIKGLSDAAKAGVTQESVDAGLKKNLAKQRKKKGFDAETLSFSGVENGDVEVSFKLPGQPAQTVTLSNAVIANF